MTNTIMRPLDAAGYRNVAAKLVASHEALRARVAELEAAMREVDREANVYCGLVEAAEARARIAIISRRVSAGDAIKEKPSCESNQPLISSPNALSSSSSAGHAGHTPVAPAFTESEAKGPVCRWYDDLDESVSSSAICGDPATHYSCAVLGGSGPDPNACAKHKCRCSGAPVCTTDTSCSYQQHAQEATAAEPAETFLSLDGYRHSKSCGVWGACTCAKGNRPTEAKPRPNEASSRDEPHWMTTTRRALERVDDQVTAVESQHAQEAKGERVSVPTVALKCLANELDLIALGQQPLARVSVIARTLRVISDAAAPRTTE